MRRKFGAVGKRSDNDDVRGMQMIVHTGWRESRGGTRLKGENTRISGKRKRRGFLGLEMPRIPKLMGGFRDDSLTVERR